MIHISGYFHSDEIEIDEMPFSDNLLVEYNQYKPIPGTRRNYRIDKAKLDGLIQKHAHTYASSDKRQLYAFNVDGTGHDGSRGCKIPSKDADYFRSIGFNLPQTNILEGIDINELDQSFKCYA